MSAIYPRGDRLTMTRVLPNIARSRTFKESVDSPSAARFQGSGAFPQPLIGGSETVFW
jgi:hypothetical protein